MFLRILLLSLLCFFCSVSAFAQVFQSSSFQIKDPVLFPSGFATSSAYSLISTIGQIAIGTSTAVAGMVREDRSGFLYFPFANSPILSASAGDGAVALSWTASVGVLGWTVSGYELGRSLISGGPYSYTPLGLVLSTTTTGLTNGTTYYFVVRVRDAFGHIIASSSQVAAVPVAPSTGSGGIGSGTPYPSPSSDSSVVFSGRAYPDAIVEVLRNGVVVHEVRADTVGNFSGLLMLTPGTYQLGFAAKDTLGRRSSLRSQSVSVHAGATTTIAGLFLSPTVAIDVGSGAEEGSISVFGSAYPQSQVTILFSEDPTLRTQVYVSEVVAGVDGRYHYRLSTNSYPPGRYMVRARAYWDGAITSLSEPEHLTLVGTEQDRPPQSECRPGDLNNDDSVDLVDFSIATYWYQRKLQSSFATKEAHCLNGDGIVNIYDFSLMAYYWTGNGKTPRRGM